MAEEQQEVRRVNWNELFSVTHVFKSFRMAIHLSKLALALAAVLLIGLLGLALDVVSGWAGVYVASDEIYSHTSTSVVEFDKWQQRVADAREQEIVKLYTKALNLRQGKQKRFGNPFREHLKNQGGLNGVFADAFFQQLDSNEPKPEEGLRELAAEDWEAALSKVKAAFDTEVENLERIADDCADGKAAKTIEEKIGKLEEDKRAAAQKKLDADLEAAQRALTRLKIAFGSEVKAIRGQTVFEAFTDFEDRCLDSALQAVRRGNFTEGLADYRAMLKARANLLAEPQAAPTALAGPQWESEKLGFFYWLLLGVHGFGWLICQHWFYAAVFLAVALAIWALFGGAMHRISALHFAREEKISITQALKFSASKFFSFYTAPLIPLAIIVVIGLLMMLGGLIFAWPGGILMGVLFPLAVIGGILTTFLLIGLVAGGWLMYPTIAVESSDSFDAISRSYSYVFSRPWRSAAYALVALIYGVICYLFVRLFAFLVLATTHWFVGAGVIGGGQTIAPAADKLDVLWPAPTFDNLLSQPPWEAMGGSEYVGGFLIMLWVIPVAASVLAFLLSYGSSVSTVIYFLLRRKVDATDLDDVYVEEPEEEPLAPQEPAEVPEPAPAEEGEEAETVEEDAPAEKPPAKPKAARKKAAKKADKDKDKDKESK